MFKRKTNPILEIFNKIPKKEKIDVDHLLVSPSLVKSVKYQRINALLNTYKKLYCSLTYI
jgi:hypothetical protein